MIDQIQWDFQFLQDNQSGHMIRFLPHQYYCLWRTHLHAKSDFKFKICKNKEKVLRKVFSTLRSLRIQKNIKKSARSLRSVWTSRFALNFLYTQKIVSLNQRNISLVYGQRKHFFELKKVLLMQKHFFLM